MEKIIGILKWLFRYYHFDGKDTRKNVVIFQLVSYRILDISFSVFKYPAQREFKGASFHAKSVIIKPINATFQSESRVLLSKLIQKYPPEIDATHLQKILRGHWKAYLLQKPSLELCKSLVMLKDYNISGRLNLMEIPVLLHMLHFWKVVI